MKLVKESLNEKLGFERTRDVKKGLGIGKRERIHRWFREWAPDAEYEIGDDLSVHVKGYLYLDYSQVTSLPEDLNVGKNIYMYEDQDIEVPEKLEYKIIR